MLERHKGMKIFLKDCIVISTVYNNEVVALYKSCEWTLWLRLARNASKNTILAFATAMDKFFIWSLYNPPKNDNFTLYLSSYRDALLQGFAITIKVMANSETGETLEVELLKVKPHLKATVNKEVAAIKSYYSFIEEDNKFSDKDNIDYAYERNRSKFGYLDGIQIKKSRPFLDIFGKKKDYVKPFRLPPSEKSKYFPYELFDKLLEIAKPRERLIYLLCFACGARIGQALNLTGYDIDFNKKEVWLIDPKSDQKGLLKIPRRKWLMEKYGIDPYMTKPHNDIGFNFKYPIPLKNEPLYWLDEKYREMFFENIYLYTNKNYKYEYQRDPMHPFFFVTKSGNRLTQRQVHRTFKRHLKELKEPSIQHLGLHSLRHGFGHVMAERYAKTGNINLITLTQEAMGHSHIDSTLKYFELSRETKQQLLSLTANSLQMDLEIEEITSQKDN